MNIRRIGFAVGVSVLAGTVFGDVFDNAWIKGVTDRSPISYKVGEFMRFALTLQGVTNKFEVGAYFLDWKRTDDFGMLETGRVDLTRLPFAYSTKLDKPGFVRLEAWVTDAKGKRVGKNPFFDGGAGADIAKLTTAPEPKDFDAFWEKQFKRLRLVPIKADVIEIKCSNPKARKFAVRIDSAGLRPVTGYLSVPKDVDAGVTYPARLYTHGYSADDCRHGTDDKAPHHEIVLDMNVHGLKLPEFGGTEADRKALRWEVRSHDCTYAFDAKQNADPEVAYFNGMVLRVKRGLQYLKTVKGWNGKELIASGGSQGGLQTIWAAACGEGVTRAESGITWCCDMVQNDDRRARKIASDGWYIPWTPSMGYYDAAIFAKRIPATCKTVITRAGLGDYCCPPMGLAKLWNNLKCPREIHWMQGSQHGYQPPAYEGRDWVLTGEAHVGTQADEYDMPVRPVGVNGQPAWNVAARQFMYAPTFDFKTIPGAARYLFSVKGSNGVRSFEADRPNAPLTPVWSAISVGDVSVSVDALAADGKVLGASGSRMFWKMPPFNEGAYPKATRGYGETAALIWKYIFNRPYLQYMLDKGEPDPSYPLNSYPAKMLAAQIWAMLRYAKMSPQDAPRAMKIAKVAADRLITRAQPAGRPLAFFPPTYDGRGEAGNDYIGEKFKGMHMLHYPSAAGLALLDYADASGEACYRDFAIKIADTYVRLQGADGTWWLKMDERTGRPVCSNRLVPIRVLEFLERIAKVTGGAKYTRAAECAFAFIEKGPLTDWNWEGQFEDIYPAPLYANLTKHGACDVAIYLLRRFPGDARRIAQARELLRWSEDQFMVWDNRYNQRGIENWTTPVALEQYHCYAPIDESAAKMMMTYLSLYRAEGNARDLAKARALGDAFTRVTLDDGRLRTYWNTDSRVNEHEDWVNGQVVSALALEDLAR